MKSLLAPALALMLSLPATAHQRPRSVRVARPITPEIARAIVYASRRYRVDADLIASIIRVESDFDPRALSRRGAMGLMQLMPATAVQLGVTNPWDVFQNVDAGVRHLVDLLQLYRGNLYLALAAYNAGDSAVAHFHGLPPYDETQQYVAAITRLYASHHFVLLLAPIQPATLGSHLPTAPVRP